MTTMINRMIIFIIFSFTIFGCEKEKLITEYIEKEHSWKEHLEVNHEDKYLVNSHSTAKELMLIGNRNFTRIDTLNNARSVTFLNDIHNTKIPLSDNVLIVMNEEDNANGLIFFYYIPEMDENSHNSSAAIQVSEIDTTFKKFDNYDETFNIPFASFNANNQILIPYKGEPFFQSFVLISFDINPNASASLSSNEYFISISETKIVKLPINVSSRAIVTYSIENDFIVSNGNVVAKIYSDGTYKVLDLHSFYPARFFKKDNKVNAVSYNSIYESIDNGESWIKKYESSEVLEGFMFTVIDNRIILSKRSTVLELIFNETGFVTEELQNDGLDGNFITSITDFNEIVYVTTLSGLYYKDKNDLFNIKETEE